MGSAHAGKVQETTRQDAYSLGPGEGDARWVMGTILGPPAGEKS